MPLYPERLRQAIATGPGLDHFDLWIRVDRRDYRVRHSQTQLEAMLTRLREVPRARTDRIAGVQRLSELPAAAGAVREAPRQPLYRVPLLVENRDELRRRLLQSGIRITHIYDPPLDDYAGAEFADLSPAPDAARWFAAHALPIDPRDAGRLLAALDELGIRLEPATNADLAPVEG